MSTPRLIAHRGYPTKYPENTLRGFEEAISLGATWLETDIQLSRDGLPVLYHDATLERTSGQPGQIWEYDAAELRQISAGYASQFGDTYSLETIPRLADLAGRLEPQPNITLLVEWKRESLKHFGRATVIAATMDELTQSFISSCIFISKDDVAIEQARREHSVRIGWVLSSYDDATRARADELQPDLMICKAARLPSPPARCWPGTWDWMVYPIDDVQDVVDQWARGISFIETNAIGELINDERINST